MPTIAIGKVAIVPSSHNEAATASALQSSTWVRRRNKRRSNGALSPERS
jgi:hypothetical protein